MNRTENTRWRVIITILLGIFSSVLYCYALDRIQYRNVMDQIQNEMEETVRFLEESHEKTIEPSENMEQSLMGLQREDTALLQVLYEDDPDFEISDAYLKKINSIFNFEDVKIVDRERNVLASAASDHRSMKDAYFDPLWKDFVSETMKELHSDRTEPEYSSMYFSGEYTDEYYEWYLLPFDNDHAFVLKCMNLVQESFYILSESNIWTNLLVNTSIGKQGYVFAWSDETNALLYYPDQARELEEVDVLGIHPDEVPDGGYLWQEIDGERMYLYTSLYKDAGVWFACAVSESELESSSSFNHIVMTIIFLLLCGALVYYVSLLLIQKKVRVLSDFTGSGKMIGHKSRQYKLLILTILFIVILFLLHFYLQTLYLMSTWAESASRNTGMIDKSVERQDNDAEIFKGIYEGDKQCQLNLVAQLIADNPQLQTSSWLDEISFYISAFDIKILDSEGNIVIGTSSMAYPSSITAGAADASGSLAGETASQDNGRPVQDWMSEGRRVILPLTGSEGSDSGYLYVHYYSLTVDQVLKSFSLEEILGRITPGNNGFVFSVDLETKKFNSYPQEDMVGRDAMEYGLSENQIKDNYCDYISIDSIPYYTVTDVIGNNLIYYTISRVDLLRRRFPVCAIMTAIAAALFFLTGMALYTSREQIEIVLPEEGRHIEKEMKSSPEYRTIRILMYYAACAAALFAAYSTFREAMGTGGVINYVLEGRWERGINVFALSSAAILLSKGGLLIFFFSRLVTLVSEILPVRGGTILKMLGSLLTYTAIAFLSYRCMICFGLNPTALMASAGIVSVVLGIGANSLVGDILAGIFLLMEGNVQVGDVVQVGDFRGYVMELGIRMTKLFDMDTDDVKIIPNNEVRNVIHMTMRAAIVYSDFQIRYEERLESVEKILREELKKVPDKSPLILDGPVYIGVFSLDENGVVLRTATRCHEPCRRKVEREVNHIVYTIFQKNNISVPYPQVTLHQGEDEPVER